MIPVAGVVLAAGVSSRMGEENKLAGDLVAGLSIGASELITKIVLYYLHERLWSRIKWGRELILEAEGTSASNNQ